MRFFSGLLTLVLLLSSCESIPSYKTFPAETFKGPTRINFGAPNNQFTFEIPNGWGAGVTPRNTLEKVYARQTGDAIWKRRIQPIKPEKLTSGEEITLPNDSVTDVNVIFNIDQLKQKSSMETYIANSCQCPVPPDSLRIITTENGKTAYLFKKDIDITTAYILRDNKEVISISFFYNASDASHKRYETDFMNIVRSVRF